MELDSNAHSVFLLYYHLVLVVQQVDRSDIVERLLMLLDEERKRIYDE